MGDVMKALSDNRLLRAVGAMFLIGAFIPLMSLPSATATASGTGFSGDSRAESYEGNVTKCNDSDPTGDGENGAGLPGQTMTSHVTSTVDDPYITISAVDAGWEVSSVVVKGGSNGYNVYLIGDLGSLTWNDLHPPLNPNEEPAGISHWFVCGTKTVVTTEPPTTEPPTTEPPTTEPPTTEPPTTEPPTTEPPTTEPPTTEPPTTEPPTTGTGGGAGGGVTPDPTIGGVSTGSGADLPATGANLVGRTSMAAVMFLVGIALIFASRLRRTNTH
ncbi:MAG: hypothetical protein GM44_4805 [actinobacterium acAMD-2]|nr:MAG: hypothetical protein GM44_4805 [actinobacterium acAMD-2]